MRCDGGNVAIVIPCYRQGRFLDTAIRSAFAQTAAPAEVIVVDDGSDEDLSPITGRHSARLIRQENRGLAGARNSGLREAASDKVIFLDADDRLRPNAIEAGLNCFGDHPDAAFVYGGFEVVAPRFSETVYSPVSTHRDLVRTNWIGMIATVMFDRAKLLAAGGFDESLGMCEDWDAYLRLSRELPFASHPVIVADYVRHRGNASNDIRQMRRWIAAVREKEWARGLSPEDQDAWREGEALWLERVPDPLPRFPILGPARDLARSLLQAVRR